MGEEAEKAPKASDRVTVDLGKKGTPALEAIMKERGCNKTEAIVFALCQAAEFQKLHSIYGREEAGGELLRLLVL